MRLRQIALVARDLEPVVAELCDVLDLEVAYNDPGVATFGLHNAVIPIGDTFLEVVSPQADETSAGRLLERRGGDGGYMVIVQSDDLDADRKRLAELGVRVVWEVALDDIATIHLHPRDVGGAILSLDVARPPSSWRWAGPEWQAHRRESAVSEITAASIQVEDPRRTAERWSAVLARPVVAPGGGRYEIPLDQGVIRFGPIRDGRGEGVAGLELKARDAAGVRARARERGLAVEDGAVIVCGTRIALGD